MLVTEKIKGVAPNASILAYRVMNDGGTGTTDDIIQGIERAIQDGADVLNLSLGQDLNVPDQPVTLTLERAAKLGVTTVVSNGNDGPKPWSVDAPGNASSVISVGASTVSIPVSNIPSSWFQQNISRVTVIKIRFSNRKCFPSCIRWLWQSK